MVETDKIMREMVTYLDPANKILEKHGYSRAKLIPILQEIQESYKWLSKDLIKYIARSVGLTPARVYGVATFYAHFALEPKGKHVFRLCDGTACHVKGSTPILDALRAKLKLRPGQTTTPDMLFTVETVSCLGACGLAPVMLVDDEVHGQLKPGDVEKIVDAMIEREKQGAKAAEVA